MARHSLKDASKLARKFFEQRAEKQKPGGISALDVEISIEPENRIDPMLMLSVYNSPDKSVEAVTPLIKALTANTKVTFYAGDTVLGQYAFGAEPNFGETFMGKPYLLNLLFDFGYGLMLGKLSLPSSVLKKQEGLSGVEETESGGLKS
jgi:hypothetical protein